MDVLIEILRWTSLVAIGLALCGALFAPFVLWMTDHGLRWMLTYIAVAPLGIAAVFLIMGLAHTYWPTATGDAEHCGEGTHYVTYHYTTYVLSGKVLVPVTETDWKCIANG